MTAAVPRRRLILGSALAVTLALAAWIAMAPDPADDEVAPAAADEQAARRQAGRTGGGPSELRPERPAAGEGEVRDLFAPQAWVIPNAPATAAGQPAAPQVPPLPFTYFGRLIDGARVTLYLAAPDRNLAVRRGDVIDGTWRIEAIRPGSVVFRYLPLGRTQTLETGGTQ